MKAFHQRGIYIDKDGNIRCRCNHTPIINWDSFKFERHFKSMGHNKYLKISELEGVQQSALDELNAGAVAKEIVCLKCAGTRSTTSVDVDRSFRDRFVAMLVTVGIPIYRSTKMRHWVERECQKTIGAWTDLRAYIPEQLKREAALRENILSKVRRIGIISDATPRGGDLMCLIERHMDLNPNTRRAEAVQQLIHLAAVKGSMNAHTLAGEMSIGLQNRRVKNEQAVVSVVDGCYTNGAAHEMTNNMALEAGEIERLEAICLAHCVSNAGSQAEFVLLDLLWSYLQKVFSQIGHGTGHLVQSHWN